MLGAARVLIRGCLLSAVALSACIIRLSERNEPLENGGVTGVPADCSVEKPLGRGEPAGEPAPKLLGRFAPENGDPNALLFDWSGSSITVRFEGTSSVVFKLSLTGEVPQDQLFTFVVDGRPPTTRALTVKRDAAGKPTLEPLDAYEISGLDAGRPHEVVVYKNTEAQKGPVIFRGVDLRGGKLLAPTRSPRRIEFIGDSITCGYGNEGKNATCPFEVVLREAKNKEGKLVPVSTPVTQNQYLAFTSIAARELGADAVTVCWSGKGVLKNYRERYVRDTETGGLVPEVGTLTTMPEYWQTRTLGSIADGPLWDFSKETPEEVPQVVVLTLGTNDFARDTLPRSFDPEIAAGDNVPDGDLDRPDELERFFQKFLALVRSVREKRPNAHIFLATSPMVTDQFPLEFARTKMRDTLLRIVSEQEAANDFRVYHLELVEQGFRYGLGCDYHPNLEVHRIMARQLAGAIRSKTCW